MSAEKSKAYFLRFLSRPGCHPCDRAEAGHQLADVNKKINHLNRLIEIYGS